MAALTVQDLITYLDAVQRVHGGAIPVWILYQDTTGEDTFAPVGEATTAEQHDNTIALVLWAPNDGPTEEELAQARAQDAADTGCLQCVGCGCTEHVGCRGGCWWVASTPPRCSNCVPDLRLTR